MAFACSFDLAPHGAAIKLVRLSGITFFLLLLVVPIAQLIMVSFIIFSRMLLLLIDHRFVAATIWFPTMKTLSIARQNGSFMLPDDEDGVRKEVEKEA